MDLATEREHLALADRHILEGEARIKRHSGLIDHLRENGRDTSTAMALLQTLQETLLVWRDHRDQILHAIARLEAEHR